MKCEECNAHLFLNKNNEFECQYCGQIAKEIELETKDIKELIEE